MKNFPLSWGASWLFYCLNNKLLEVRKMDINELIKKPYLNEFETAALTGRAVSTLRNDRHLRRGFPYLKIGKRSIRYKTATMVSCMEANPVDPNELQGGAK
jgi:hypothetical protein